ncbi:MAG: hypothetical protein R3E98_21750, partial [Gemmatimonadota bacterium]
MRNASTDASRPGDVASGRDAIPALLWTFALLAGALALFLPRGAADEGMARSLSTVWATLLLLAAAFTLAPARTRSPKDWHRWRVAWTTAWLLFGIHCVVSILGPLGGSFGAMFETPLVSTPVFNLVLSAWWTVDVALAWLSADPSERDRRVHLQRTGLLFILLVAFLVASVVQGTTTARFLGAVVG